MRISSYQALQAAAPAVSVLLVAWASPGPDPLPQAVPAAGEPATLAAAPVPSPVPDAPPLGDSEPALLGVAALEPGFSLGVVRDPAPAAAAGHPGPAVRDPAPPLAAAAVLAPEPGPVLPQDPPPPHSLQLTSGIGFTADPTTFLLGMQLDVSVAENFAIGPLVQLGVDDNTTLVAPSAQFKGVFHEEEFHPYVQAGLGFGYLEKDHRQGDDDEVAFLLNFGGGVDVDLSDSVALGTGMLFNFLPDEAVGERFFFSWQVLTLGFRF